MKFKEGTLVITEVDEIVEVGDNCFYNLEGYEIYYEPKTLRICTFQDYFELSMESSGWENQGSTYYKFFPNKDLYLELDLKGVKFNKICYIDEDLLEEANEAFDHFLNIQRIFNETTS